MADTMADVPVAPDWVLKWAKRGVWAGVWFVVIALGVAFVRRDAWKYIEWSEAVYQRFWPNRILLATHVAAAGVALLIAPLQFVKPLRIKWPRIHRAIGWVYVVCAILSAIVSYRLSFYACPMCVPPFVMWSVVFFIVTTAAIVMAIQRNLKAHRHFMIRSYVLMNAFVLVRLDAHLIDTPLEIPLPMGPGVERAPMLLWVVWVVPLLITEMWLSWYPAVRRRRKVRRAAPVGSVK